MVSYSCYLTSQFSFDLIFPWLHSLAVLFPLTIFLFSYYLSFLWHYSHASFPFTYFKSLATSLYYCSIFISPPLVSWFICFDLFVISFSFLVHFFIYSDFVLLFPFRSIDKRIQNSTYRYATSSFKKLYVHVQNDKLSLLFTVAIYSFIYLYETRMIYLYLKGKDTPFLCDFIHYIMNISKSKFSISNKTCYIKITFAGNR